MSDFFSAFLCMCHFLYNLGTVCMFYVSFVSSFAVSAVVTESVNHLVAPFTTFLCGSFLEIRESTDSNTELN